MAFCPETQKKGRFHTRQHLSLDKEAHTECVALTEKACRFRIISAAAGSHAYYINRQICSRRRLNSTPFVRQYGILVTNGVLFYAKRSAEQEVYRGIQTGSR